MSKYILLDDEMVFVKALNSPREARAFIAKEYPEATEEDPLDPYYEDIVGSYEEHGEVCSLWEINDFLDNSYIALIKY